jgi:hypothetical protein
VINFTSLSTVAPGVQLACQQQSVAVPRRVCAGTHARVPAPCSACVVSLRVIRRMVYGICMAHDRLMIQTRVITVESEAHKSVHKGERKIGHIRAPDIHTVPTIDNQEHDHRTQ